MATTKVEEFKASRTDWKRYLWVLGLLIPAGPLLAGFRWAEHETTLVLWQGPFMIFALGAMLDFVVGEDRHNPRESEVSALSEDPYYRWILYAFVPLMFASYIWGGWMIANVDLTLMGMLGVSVSVGVVCGIGINVAHELGHKNRFLERTLAKLTLSTMAYGHFIVEHNRGHHVRVATPEDPASSRYGESFYRFWPRTVVGSFRSAWELERERLQRAGRSVWHTDNVILQCLAMSAVLFAGMIAAFGPVVVPYLAIVAVIGFSLLEVVNYLEHYGLLRQKRENGRYEPCRPEHSWNSNHLVSNVFLYNLQRHSDHHANPTRWYPALRHFEEAPQLPSGYAGMVPLALIPPLWRMVMDPKVKAHYGGDLSRANLDPRVRDRILAEQQEDQG